MMTRIAPLSTVTKLMNGLPSGIYTFPFWVCTLSVGLLCSYLGTSGLGWMRLAAIGAAGNGVALVLAAVLIGGLMSDSFLTARMHEQPAVARLIMMVISGVAGAAVGGFVLTLFARSIQSGRIPAPLPMLSAPPIAPIGDLLGALSKGDISPNGTAPLELGSYNRASVAELEGRYVCFRPTFSNPKVINAYLVIVQWDEKHSCLVFEEQNRPDSMHTQKGKVYIPDGKPFMSFVTVDRGAIRVIMVTRPDEGPARGLMLTLSNPGEMHFIPASAPLVLRRIGEETPQLGFVHPGAPDYDRYLGELASVGPGFARFARISPAATNGSSSNPTVMGGSKMRKRRRPAHANGGQEEHVENDVAVT
jgi:hypothetical protein